MLTPNLVGFRLTKMLGTRVLKHDGGVRAIAVAPDGSLYASAGDGDRLHLWNAETGEAIAHIPGRSAETLFEKNYALCFSDDGRIAFVGGSQIQLFAIETKNWFGSIETDPAVKVAAMASHGDLLLFGDGARVRCMDFRKSEPAFLMKKHTARVNACALSAKHALTCGADRQIVLHALDPKRKKPKIVATHEGYTKSCGIAPDGLTAWSVGWDHVFVLDTKTGAKIWELEGALAKARVGAMSPDGRWLAAAYSSEILVFDRLAPSSVEPEKRVACNGAETMTFDRQGRLLVSNYGYGTGEGCAIEVFDLETERRVLPAEDAGHVGAVIDLKIPRDRPNLLVSTGVDRRVLIWDLDLGSTVEQLALSDQGNAIDITNDARTLVTSSQDGKVLAWDLATTSAREFEGTDRQGRSIAISPDGHWLACPSLARREVMLFDLTAKEIDGTPSTTPKRRLGGYATALAFSLDSSHLVVGNGGELSLWSLANEEAAKPTFSLNVSFELNAIVQVDRPPRLVCGAGPYLTTLDTVGRRLQSQEPVETAIQDLAAVDEDYVVIVRAAPASSPSGKRIFELRNLTSSKAKPKPPDGSVDLAPVDDQPRSVCTTPDGRFICVGTNVGTILVLERAGLNERSNV